MRRGNFAAPHVVQGYDGPNDIVSRYLRIMSAKGGTMAAIRANSPLPRNAEELMDNELIRVGRQGLQFTEALIAAKMVRPLPNWLSVPVLTSKTIGEAGRAQRTAVPIARGERQKLDLGEYSIPVFTTWDDIEFDVRTLLTAERAGYAMLAEHTASAAINVNEAVEDTNVNGLVDADGTHIDVYGERTYGVLQAPNANTQAYETGTAWDDSGKTGAEILTDVLAMIAKAKAAFYRGPYRLFIPSLYELALMKEYGTAYPRTILSRLLEIPSLQGITTVDMLPANRTVLMQMTPNVADLVIGQTPATYTWESQPGHPFSGTTSMVMAVIVPRFKTDKAGRSGIVLGYTS